MSNACFKHFSRWGKSFTRTEICLCILQAFLLVSFFICLTFLILHLHACSKFDTKYNENYLVTITTTNKYEFNTVTEKIITSKSSTTEQQCTWKPNHKTKALTQYFDTSKSTKGRYTTSGSKSYIPAKEFEQKIKTISTLNSNYGLSREYFNSKEADNVTKRFILALVKIKLQKDMTFGCTLTIVSEYWALTAASCIEAIEEMDTLDSFVMIEGLGEERAKTHEVTDILIHPQYQGINYSYDLTALKSEDSIRQKDQMFVRLPTVVDYLMIPIGEHLTVLGHGNYRALGQEPSSRRAHAMSVHLLPWRRCAGVRGDGWSPRHLAGGHAVGEGRACGGAEQVCAGGPEGDGGCSWRAGTPLVRGAVLVGVRRGGHVSDGCGPAAYVNLARMADWLRATIR